MKQNVTTRVTRIVTVEFTGEQVAAILRKECGFNDDAHVDWDASQDYVRAVMVTSTTVEQDA